MSMLLLEQRYEHYYIFEVKLYWTKKKKSKRRDNDISLFFPMIANGIRTNMAYVLPFLWIPMKISLSNGTV